MTEPTARELRLREMRAYICQSAYVGLVALLFVVVAISFFLSPVHMGLKVAQVPSYDYYMNAFFLLGGALVMFGLPTRRVGVEAAGHILLLPGLTINLVVAFHYLGFHASSLLAFCFLAGAGLRAWGLVMGWQEHD